MSDPTPEEQLDEFLAAPEQLLRSSTELGKAKKRKARDQARKDQLASTKLKESPSIEDMLGDIVRVAEDRDLNPFWEFRSMSARRYELYGKYDMGWINAQFGQFSHALEVSGLRDQPGTRLWKANRARASRSEHAARYLERYVQPYVVRREAMRMVRGSYRMLSISDLHSMMLCPFTFLAFLSAVRELKPEGVLINGDAMDTVQLSRHPKVPGWTPPLQDELDFQCMILREIRKVHQGDLFMTGGNHDLPDRLAMYLTQVAKDLAGLRSLRVDELMGLKEYGVQLFHGGSIVSPAGQEDAHTGFLMFEFYRVHHGNLLGASPALAELRAAGRSGQSGHVHRSSLAYGTTEADEALCWMSTPMACRHEVARHYCKGVTTGWQRGFGVAELFADGTVHQYPCVVRTSPKGGERLTCEGFTWERPEDLLDPDPNALWLDDPRYQLK